MPEKPPLITLMDSQHVKESETLPKSTHGSIFVIFFGQSEKISVPKILS